MATYFIQSHSGTGKHLNVSGNNQISDHRNVNVYNYSGGNDQKWIIEYLNTYDIYPQLIQCTNNSSYGLNAYRVGTNWNCDIMPTSGNFNDALVVFEGTGITNEFFIKLKNYSNRYLTAEGTTSGSNTSWQAKQSSGNAQKWKITLVSGGGTAKSLSMPAGKNCNWNQKHSRVTDIFGGSACTLVTGLDVANFYSVNTTGYVPEDMYSTVYWTTEGRYTRVVPGPGTIGDKLAEFGTDADRMASIKSEIDAGRPVVVNIGPDDNNNHTVFAFGYTNNASSYSDILVHDPVDMNTSSIYGRIVTLYNAMDYNGDKFNIRSIRQTYAS